MKSRLFFWTVLVASVAILDACGGKTDNPLESCTPGEIRACGAKGSCYEQCLASGDAYSDCTCGGAGSGGGGYGGYPVGGTGAYGGDPIGGSGGDPGGSGGQPCGNCPEYKLPGLFDMKPCCSVSGGCGALVEPSVAALIGMNPGCYPTNQAGAVDPSCPALFYPNLVDGGPGSFAGCCSATTGTCGVMIDTTSLGGPHFGCTDVGAAGGGPQKCGSSSGSCSVCAHAQCSVELNACTSNQQCTEILSCVSACTEQACVDKCVAGYPAGKPTFYGFMTCVEQKCQTECQ